MKTSKRGPKTRDQNRALLLSLSLDARLRGGTLLLLLLHHRPALLLLLLLRLVFTRLLSRSVCLCLSAAADSVLKTLYTGRATRWAFFFVEIRLIVVGNWLHLKQKECLSASALSSCLCGLYPNNHGAVVARFCLAQALVGMCSSVRCQIRFSRRLFVSFNWTNGCPLPSICGTQCPPPRFQGFRLQQSCTSGTLLDFTHFTLLVFNILFDRAAGCFAKSIFLLLWNIL